MLEYSPFRHYIIGTETLIPLPEHRLVKYINFDNAATTPPMKCVLEAINEFSPWYSSIHRGKGYKSLLTTRVYEEGRSIIKDFINADPDSTTVIYVKNTTEAINKLSYRLCQRKRDSEGKTDREDCVILSTDMEHHSNDLPWRERFKIDYIEIDRDGCLSLENLEAKLIEYQGKVELVTITGASNVTGYINPVNRITGLCHQYNARVLLDGAQLIPHQPVNMQELKVDFLVFSAHKMYAPFGMGVLIGPDDFFQKGVPEYKGGGTVQIVTQQEVLWDKSPQRDEAGTPNVMGVIALTAAIKKLNEIGMERVSAYEQELTAYTVEKMRSIPGIRLYNDKNSSEKVSIIPFNIDGMTHEEVADILAQNYGIAVRNGCFCAQPYIQKLLKVSEWEIKKHIRKPDSLHPGLVRISFGMYNQREEIDYLIEALKKIVMIS